MLRLRFYRVLLPAILVLFIVVLALQLRPVGVTHSQAPGTGLEVGSSGTGITAVDMDGDRKTLEISADGYHETADGKIRLERINELKVFREGKLPLLIEALSGDMEGESGARNIYLSEGVTVEDPEKELKFHIPKLAVDEENQEATSDSQVRLEGAGLGGVASSLVYRLDDRPAELTDIDFSDDTGSRLRSKRAVLHDGVDDVELIDEVHVVRGEEFLDADRLRLKRRENDRLQRATATGEVRGALRVGEIELWSLSSETLDARFDDNGDPRRIELIGGAYLSRGVDSLSAETIDARRFSQEVQGWRLTCEGGVVLDGMINLSPAVLRAATIRALYLPLRGLVEAQAQGRVSFDGEETRGEAARATYQAGEIGEVRLFGSSRRKARMAHLETRVAAEEIAFAADGSRLFAERGVESSLLPGARSEGDNQIGPFAADEPIHFVSATLEGRDSGSVLIFEGEVRGWQGERNLAAERISLDQEQRTLTAEQNVSARMPRVSDRSAVGQADFVQITSGRLDYSEIESEGVFRDNVRVYVDEGWMESNEVRVRTENEGGVSEVIAAGDVRIEFRRPAEGDNPAQLMTGNADRLVYSPDQETIWLIGENSPASVTQVGEGQGTTTGRVLRYQLEAGTLEVDSGDGGPATIRTGG